MKFFFGLLIIHLSLFGTAQNTATFSLSNVDATYLLPGDTIVIDAYLDEISHSFQSVQFCILYDTNVLMITENPFQNVNELFEFPAGCYFTIENGKITLIWSNPFFHLVYLEEGDLMFSVVFVYLGEECDLSWSIDPPSNTFLLDGYFHFYDLSLIDGSISNYQQVENNIENNVLVSSGKSKIIIRDEENLFSECFVFEMSGRKILECKLNNIYNQIPVDHGIYIVNLRNKQKSYTSKLFVNP